VYQGVTTLKNILTRGGVVHIRVHDEEHIN
jgi:hypothetical protein